MCVYVREKQTTSKHSAGHMDVIGVFVTSQHEALAIAVAKRSWRSA